MGGRQFKVSVESLPRVTFQSRGKNLALNIHLVVWVMKSVLTKIGIKL